MDGIEEVKARLSIEDVISEYVQLKRAGRNFKGLSPFTSERTPSFVVSPEKQIWHDFSSGKGGNMFSFVMEMEGLDFKGALEHLARKAGVDLDRYRTHSRGGGPNKERLHELLELATKFYQVQFSNNRVALAYVFKKRQFTKETALAWRLGYSPNNGTALVDFLKTRGFTADEMRQAGVTSQRRTGLWDMFRGRLMVPLCDPQGRVIGFTARLLTDDKNAPKYINTPQTVLYDKSRHVFGLHHAKEGIRKSKFVVVTEGNLDVIASHQAGVKQTIAVAGTALTEQHLKALSRFTGDIRLCFDADRAGVAATERAIPLAGKIGVSLSVIDIPSGKDPDELIRHDPAVWHETITKHRYALDWLMDRYARQLDLTSAQGKREYSDILLPIVRRLSDPVEQDHYMAAIAAATDTSRQALTAKLEKTPADAPKIVRQRRELPPIDKQSAEDAKAEEHFMTLLLMQPLLRPYAAPIELEMLGRDESRQLLLFLREHPDFAGRPSDAIDLLRPLADYVKILGLQYEELYQDLDSTELQYEVARLAARHIEKYVKQQKVALAAQLETADEATTQALLTRAAQLDALLRQTKGGI
ncbi:MAG TPA: DNA primase [Candidatus Saccharimonadales bacterium]|nr:DNA primase [Candidatus Saccharimonadales bacterium]